MSPMLKHPKTGRTVSVTDKQAGFYTDNGWAATNPEPTESELAAEAAEKEAADLAAKQAAEAAAKEAESKKEPADGADAGSGKPTARKAAKAD